MIRLFFLPLLFFASTVLGQTKDRKASWEEMIETGSHQTALAEIEEFTQSLINQKQYDSLPEYLEIYGRILLANFPEKDASDQLLNTYQT